MSGAIQAVNYNHEPQSETYSFEVGAVAYQIEEAKETKGHSINLITFQSEEAECNNTLFFYL